jgi:hypothetical protein
MPIPGQVIYLAICDSVMLLSGLLLVPLMSIAVFKRWWTLEYYLCVVL